MFIFTLKIIWSIIHQSEYKCKLIFSNVTQKDQPIFLMKVAMITITELHGVFALNVALVSIDQKTIHANKQKRYKEDINEWCYSVVFFLNIAESKDFVWNQNPISLRQLQCTHYQMDHHPLKYAHWPGANSIKFNDGFMNI